MSRDFAIMFLRDHIRGFLVMVSCLTAAILAALIPVNFFISILQTDALNYYLMAEKVALNGHPAAALAVNQPAFVYASGTSYIYAPAMMLFKAFNFRLRGIQGINIALLGCYLALAFQYIRKLLPHRIGMIASILFAVTVLMDWRTLYLVMMPNADLVPAIVAVASFLVASNTRLNDSQKLLLILALCIPAFFVKMSVIVLPVAFSLQMLARGSRNIRLIALIAPVGAILLFTFYWATVLQYFHIIHIYTENYFQLLGHGQTFFTATLSMLGTVTANLLFGALPEAVIPNFHFFFFSDVAYPSQAISIDAITVRSIIGLFTGGVISFVIAIGALRLSRSQSFDLLALALALPIFALITDGTSRYLVGYQPLLWCCFMTTLASWVLRVSWNKLGAWAAVTGSAIIILAVQNHYVSLRSKRLGSLGNVAGVGQYFGNVAKVFGGARGYLETLSADNALIILIFAEHYQSTVWTAVSGIENYDINRYAPGWSKGKRVFLVAACRQPWCNQYLSWKPAVQKRLGGDCASFDLRASWINESASAEIFELNRNETCHPGKL